MVIGAGVVVLIVVAGVGVVTMLPGADKTSSAPNPEGAPPGPPITLVAELPPGATMCPPVYPKLDAPFNRGARGTPQTSCGLVEQTRREYSKPDSALGARRLRVASPATFKWYDLTCTPPASFVTCTGGVGVIIYLYTGS